MQYLYFLFPLIYIWFYTVHVVCVAEEGNYNFAKNNLYLYTFLLCLYLSPRIIESDFIAYMKHYNDYVSGYAEHNPLFMHWDWLYEMTNKLCAYFKLPFWGVFCILLNLMIQPVLYFVFSEDLLRKYLPVCAIMVFLGIGFMGNAIRQSVAIAFFVLSIKYIINRSLLKYVICLFIAFGFHFSVIFFSPLYFLWNHFKIPSVKTQMMLFGGSYIIGRYLVPYVHTTIVQMGRMVGKIYQENTRESETLLRTDYGVGFFVVLLIYLIVVYYYSTMEEIRNRKMDFIYFLFMLGICFSLISSSVTGTLGRANYFIRVQPIILAFWLCFMYSAKNYSLNNLIVFYSVSIYYFLAFVSHLSDVHYAGIMPLKFIWE